MWLKNLGHQQFAERFHCSWMVAITVSLCTINLCAQQLYQDGVRPGGMGDAYAAISDDVTGVRFNPSGLIYSPQDLQFEFSTQSLFSSGLPFQTDFENEGNISLFSLGGVRNHIERPNRTIPVFVRSNNSAAGMNGQANSLEDKSPLSPTATKLSYGGLINFLKTGFLNQIAIRGFIAKGFFRKTRPDNLSASQKHFPYWIAVSLTGKVLNYQYASNIVEAAEVNTEAERTAIKNFFDTNDNSSYSGGVDLGATLHLDPRVRVGMMLTDFLQPNVGLATVSKYPWSVRGGAALVIKPEWQWVLAGDLEKRDKDDAMKLYVGTESRLTIAGLDDFKVRFGANPNWFSAGFSVMTKQVAVHYAFLDFRHYNSFYNHRLSLSLALSGGKSEEEAR